MDPSNELYRGGLAEVADGLGIGPISDTLPLLQRGNKIGSGWGEVGRDWRHR